eukprot:GFUD01023533.1.p1 GENE.GFUD01023533.1~~GFUD01023533.1.p1  ORF type:complete len:251 (+),score=87.42 GFUD01023533.1:65-817(+)
MSLPRSVLITGSNRGIGLELVKQFLQTETPPQHIFATYRNATNSEELLALAQSTPTLHLLQMDVTDQAVHAKVVETITEVVGEEGLNLLINNAGVLPQNRDLQAVTPEDMRNAFETNCIAPLFLSRALLPLIKKAADKNAEAPLSVAKAAIVQMSTAVASIAENSGGGMYAYRCSKAALNMSMKSLSVDLSSSGILVMAMHPGWVLTEMGGPNAQISTETCCQTMVQTLAGLTEKDHGAFLRYNNTAIPW